jgi:hypothetical protein
MEYLACLWGEQSTMAGMAAFAKLQQKKVKKSGGNSKRIEITMGITCHTCHVFSVFSLGTLFGDIATCHRTCHGFAIAGKSG